MDLQIYNLPHFWCKPLFRWLVTRANRFDDYIATRRSMVDSDLPSLSVACVACNDSPIVFDRKNCIGWINLHVVDGWFPSRLLWVDVNDLWRRRRTANSSFHRRTVPSALPDRACFPSLETAKENTPARCGSTVWSSSPVSASQTRIA